MDYRKKTREQIIVNNHQSLLPKYLPMVTRKFSDREFLPMQSSVVRNGETIAIQWLRPEQIRWSKEAQQYPLTVFNQPQSKDIIQGTLGDCWLVSALSLIAEKPEILYKIMITKQYNPAGVYKIRLCNRGIWQVITIDDILPVTESKTFIFTRAHKKQLFASLIEKAVAKMHGGYEALESGRCVEGLQTLTGKPCEAILLYSNDPKKQPNLNEIWTKIIRSRAKGYLMTCLSSNRELNEEFFHQMELDHAYSILDARQIGAQRLVRLRNPWGKKDPYGTSSDNDGVFWMPWEKMVSFFSEISICKISGNEYESRQQGRFSNFSSKITSAYNLDCSYGGEIDIELFNIGCGKSYNRSQDLDIDIFLIVLSSNGSCIAYKHCLDYHITVSITVPPGQYIVLVGSISIVTTLIYPRFNLVVHSAQPIVFNQRPASGQLVGNAFHAVAMRNSQRKDFGDNVSILTFKDSGGFGFICENKSNRALHLTTDFQGSMNVISSRNTFHMIDVVPAKTKLLFAFFTRKSTSENVHIAYEAEYQTINPKQVAAHMQNRHSPPIPSAAIGLHIFKSTI